MSFTIGSLFDGSGGFPLAASLCGIEPKWASEIEPYPIRVTTKRFPHIKHLGDVSKVNGADIEPVDVITGGFPCQSVSIAGKREGVKHSANGDDETTRSGLFYEIVRIVKEMKESTNNEYPKFLVLENVPGLLSINKGEDFKKILTEIEQLGFIADVNILDAQDMGVPQRRKRVYITCVNADFILKKKTNLSDSIILQLLAELSLMNLVEALEVFREEHGKLTVIERKFQNDGLKRRMNLFSLQKEDHLQMLLERWEEMKQVYRKEQRNLGLNLGEYQMEMHIPTGEATRLEDISTKNLSMNTEKLWKNILAENSQRKNEYTISTSTKETTIYQICTCLIILENIWDVIIDLMQSLVKDQKNQLLNYYEWVISLSTEMEEFINATRKNTNLNNELGWNEFLRNIECKLREARNYIKSNTARKCIPKVLFEQGRLPWHSTQSREEGQGITRDTENCPRATNRESNCLTPWDVQSRQIFTPDGPWMTLYAGEGGGRGYVMIPCYDIGDRRVVASEHINICPTLLAKMGTGGNNVPCVIGVDCYNFTTTGDKGRTLSTPSGGLNEHIPCVIEKQAIGFDGYNADTTGDVSATLGVNCGMSTVRNGVIEQETYTLEPGIAAREGGHIYEGVSGTLRANAGDNQMSVCYAVENHPNDSRVKICEDGKCQTLSQRMGTGGGNVPLVLEKNIVYNGSNVTSPTNASMPNWNDPCHTLHNDSRNILIQEKSYCLQGSMIGRQEQNGPQGDGINEDISFTLNTADKHAVCCKNPSGGGITMCATTGSFMQVNENKSPTLAARDYKDPNIVCYANQAYGKWGESDKSSVQRASGGDYGGGSETLVVERPQYIVRRLTPLECCRLQGFPDWWEQNLATDEPTEEDLIFWREVFETHRKIVTGASKSKTDKQIIKWLKDPYSDSASYKMWGNGIALPNALYVMQGIAECLKERE